MTEKDKKSIEDAMIDSIAIDKVRDLVSDVAEVGLDSVLEAGLLKDIPLIGFVAKSVGAAFAIRDRIFAKKVLRFLAQLDDIPQYKKQEFVDTLKDDKARQKVGENLIIALDRLDSIEKAQIIGRLFGAYIKGEISYSVFSQLASSIDRVYLENLRLLIKLSHSGEYYLPDDRSSFWILENLYSLGFLERSEGLYAEIGWAMGIGKLGRLLVEIALRDWLEENHDAEFDD